MGVTRVMSIRCDIVQCLSIRSCEAVDRALLFSSLFFYLAVLFPRVAKQQRRVVGFATRQGEQSLYRQEQPNARFFSFFFTPILSLGIEWEQGRRWRRRQSGGGTRFGRKGEKAVDGVPIVFPCWAAPFGGGGAVRATTAHCPCSPSPSLPLSSSFFAPPMPVYLRAFAPHVSLWPHAACPFSLFVFSFFSTFF
nr:hypothetical protein [Pandoravirus aubagnensis]